MILTTYESRKAAGCPSVTHITPQFPDPLNPAAPPAREVSVERRRICSIKCDRKVGEEAQRW